MFQCVKCQTTFTRKFSLDTHLAKKKPCSVGQYNKTCLQCNKKFSSIQSYKYHTDGRCRKKPNQDLKQEPNPEPNPELEQDLNNNYLLDELNNIKKLLYDCEAKIKAKI